MRRGGSGRRGETTEANGFQRGKGHKGSSAAEEVTSIELSIHGCLDSQAILDSQVMIIEK